MMRFIFTHAAHTVTRHALEHGRRLGHSHQGGEHLLLALAAADLPVAAVLREHGVTAERVEEEIVRLEGLGPGAALFAGLDPGALASIGVDLAAVRDRIEASFGPGALVQAARAAHVRPRRPSGLNPNNPRPMPPGPIDRWRRRHARPAAPLPPIPPAPPGLYQAAGTNPAGQINRTPDAWHAVRQSVREAQIRHETQVGAEHLASTLTGF